MTKINNHHYYLQASHIIYKMLLYQILQQLLTITLTKEIQSKWPPSLPHISPLLGTFLIFNILTNSTTTVKLQITTLTSKLYFLIFTPSKFISHLIKVCVNLGKLPFQKDLKSLLPLLPSTGLLYPNQSSHHRQACHINVKELFWDNVSMITWHWCLLSFAYSMSQKGERMRKKVFSCRNFPSCF